MAPDDVIDRAIEEIADGRAIDWRALEGSARSAEQREYLKCLRILDGIADVHRSEDITHATEPHVDVPVDPEATTEDRSEMWGRYRLVQKVGEGSFGSVYRAWDSELEREVAIKILHHQIADSELKRRLLREGRALARVVHPNVVNVFGVESHGNQVGLCMEFIRGETLDTVLRSHGTLNAREAILIGEDICRALAAVHLAGFVHRDVKARNVMRETAGRIVLMDFGTGRETEQAARAGRVDVAGTPVYMAPEVLDGEPATVASDVYSVGVLVYHLVTGEYPVEGRTMDALREAHRLGRRRLLSDRRPDLPLPFIQVVERALTPDPEQRCPTAGALLEALGALSSSDDRKSQLIDYLLPLGLAFLGTTVALIGLGMLSSRVFNGALGRSDFAGEGVRDWLYYGAASCLAPAALLMISFVSLGLLVVLRRLVVTVSARARVWDAAMRGSLDRLARKLHLNDVSVLASSVLLVSASALIVAWWHYAPLLGAVFPDVSTAPADSLRLLAPAPNGTENDYHVNYRLTFVWIAFPSILVWYLIARLAAKKRETLPWGVVAGAVGVIVLALASLDCPYRMLYHNIFEAVKWQGGDCYILGTRRDDVLLFCPSLQPSRNRIVKSNDPNLERTGLRESIFTRFATEDPTR